MLGGQLTTDWTVRGSKSGGGEIFCTNPDQPWGPPSLLCNKYGVFVDMDRTLSIKLIYFPASALY